jgi:hypothetical protein
MPSSARNMLWEEDHDPRSWSRQFGTVFVSAGMARNGIIPSVRSTASVECGTLFFLSLVIQVHCCIGWKTAQIWRPQYSRISCLCGVTVSFYHSTIVLVFGTWYLPHLFFCQLTGVQILMNGHCTRCPSVSYGPTSSSRWFFTS